MFVGAINEEARRFLAANANVFNGVPVVVGCSGNFTLESTIAAVAQPAAIHSNDVSLYSSALGAWLSGRRMEYAIVNAEYEWLRPFMDDPEERLAVLMLLLDMLEFEKRNNAHAVRMWELYKKDFVSMIHTTVVKLRSLPLRISDYYAGDVMEHFERFANVKEAVFCCYAPTYSGGYERMYKRLDKIFAWDAPTYPLLDDARRADLLNWMRERDFLWYDDREIEGLTPIMEQNSGLRRTVWLYSNVMQKSALFSGMKESHLPRWPIAMGALNLSNETEIWLKQIKTSDLMLFKEAYLGKNIAPASGMWAFAVMADVSVIGFLEFGYKAMMARDQVYMMADFCVPGTRYARLSKLIVALACCGDMARILRRLKEYPVRSVRTTAFTERPVSMKYRGVMKLEKRGEGADGKKFLNYAADFNDKTRREVYLEWLKKHGSPKQ